MDSIQYLTVPIDALRKNTFNSNKVSALNEEKIRKSIERNGLFKPIIVREIEGVAGYEIIGGEHRWEQARELGYTTVPIANLGPISDIKAKEISVIDNARYGVDDTVLFADILKDIGDLEEITHFLPYGDHDLSAIFAASHIALDDLELTPDTPETSDIPEEKAAKPAKTHTIMRFKIGLMDAERLTALIAATQRAQGLTTADELTNAGDALIHLLGAQLSAPTGSATALNWDDMLDDIEIAQREAEE